MGDVSSPLVEDVVAAPVLVAPVEDNIAINKPVHPLPVNLDNLIRDLDLEIDEMWRERREPTLSSGYKLVGPNVEISNYCTCDRMDDEVTSGFEPDLDILILC